MGDGRGRRRVITLVDAGRDVISMTMFTDALDRFYPILKMNSNICVSGGIVKNRSALSAGLGPVDVIIGTHSRIT